MKGLRYQLKRCFHPEAGCGTLNNMKPNNILGKVANMKRRPVALLLAAVFMLSVVPVFSPSARAASGDSASYSWVDYETASLWFDDGTVVDAYVCCPCTYPEDLSMVGSWGNDIFTLDSFMTQAFELKGNINNCYGITIGYSIDSVAYGQDAILAAGMKAGMRMNGTWSFGDYHTELDAPLYDGIYYSVYNKTPGTLSAVTVVPAHPINTRFSYSGSMMYDMRLYFATEEAAELYMNSVFSG